MTSPSPDALLDALAAGGHTFVTSVPDKGLAPLIAAVDNDRRFAHVPCTREEEAVGLCAGAAFAGRRGVVLLQNSGIGNAVNALTSLMSFYDLPLLLLVSQRGGATERIAAQRPMGRATRPVLEACGVRVVEAADIAELRAVIANAADERIAIVGTPEQWAQLTG